MLLHIKKISTGGLVDAVKDKPPKMVDEIIKNNG